MYVCITINTKPVISGVVTPSELIMTSSIRLSFAQQFPTHPHHGSGNGRGGQLESSSSPPGIQAIAMIVDHALQAQSDLVAKKTAEICKLPGGESAVKLSLEKLSCYTV